MTYCDLGCRRPAVEALIDAIESGWEDEPTEAEQELARTVARNVLASDWLASLLADARREGGDERAEKIAQAIEAERRTVVGNLDVRDGLNRAALLARSTR